MCDECGNLNGKDYVITNDHFLFCLAELEFFFQITLNARTEIETRMKEGINLKKRSKKAIELSHMVIKNF